MGLLVGALVCTALLPGCPQAQAPAAQAFPPVQKFVISYQRSGGLAPSSAELTVAPGRRATASIEGGRAGDRTVRFRIGVVRIRTLQRDLAKAHFGALGSPPPGNCADCYGYELSYRGHSVGFGESTMPTALQPVVGELESLITAHAIPPDA